MESDVAAAGNGKATHDDTHDAKLQSPSVSTLLHRSEEEFQLNENENAESLKKKQKKKKQKHHFKKNKLKIYTHCMFSLKWLSRLEF